MSIWFDKSKKRWRVRIRRRGEEISKTLPRGIHEATAIAIHEKCLSEVLLGNPLRERLTARALADNPGWNIAVGEWYATPGSRLHRLLASAKTRDRARGYETTLTLEQLRDLALQSRGRCALSGVSFSDEIFGKGRLRPLAMSLDRIRSGGGYSKGNCRFVCVAINLALGSWGDAVLRRLAYGIVVRDYF